VLNITQILEPIQDQLALVEDKMRQPLPHEYKVMTVVIEQLLASGGKRIRPALALLACRLYPVDPAKSITLAASVEMLHTATLVHDDLIDNALFRRNMPTLNATWTSGMTVLAGDYLFARAAYLAALTDNVRVMNIFSRTLMTICTGELRQQIAKSAQSREEYYERIYAKTAALLMAATEAAGVLAEIPEEHIQALSDYGHYVGMAFQIVDDILDFVSDEATLGKPVGSDLAQGLITLPTLCYLEHHPECNHVKQVLEGTHNPDTVKQAVQAIKQSGAIDAAMAEARAFVQRSHTALESLPNVAAIQSLHDLADYVVQRKL
jgi:geranylgeranyl pyrophosphate synthase